MSMFKHFSQKNLLKAQGALLAAAVMVLAGCSTDSPTAPNQGGQNPGSGQGSGNQWVITVTASPSTIELANATPTSNILVDVRQVGTGQAPPEGTLFQLTVTNGNINGETSLFGGLSRGRFSTTFTATTAGTALITATLEQSVGQKAIQVISTDDSTFALTHMEPNHGDPAGGDVVAIFGQNIREPVQVTFGSNNAEILGVLPTRIRVRTPPSSTSVPVGTILQVGVNVTSGFGTQFQASASLNGGFIYAHGNTPTPPQAFSLNPDTGPVAGGTTVAMQGSGFSNNLRVMMQIPSGPVVDLQQISSSSTQVIFLTPAASALAPPADWDGNTDVWAQDLNTGLESNRVTFHYGATIFVSSIVPATGDPAGGETVTIIGSGFESPMQVFIGGVEQTITNLTSTQITIVTSPAPASVCSPTELPVVVKNVITGVESDGDVTFTYQSGTPVVASVSPGNRPHSGGGGVTISGSNFGIGGSGVQVRFGTNNAPSPVVVSENTITTTVPASGVPPEACDSNNDGVEGTSRPATQVGVTVINLPQGCSDTLAGAFQYNAEACNDPARCSNGIDDDMDGDIDFPDDAECSSAADDDEAS